MIYYKNHTLPSAFQKDNNGKGFALPMEKNLKIRIYLACAVLILTIAGCIGFGLSSSEPTLSGGDPTVSILPNGQELYQQAANAAAKSDHYVLTISESTHTSINGQTYTETAKQTVSFQDALIHTSEARMIGDYSIPSALTYSDGTAYLTLGNSRFYSSMSELEYRSKYVPVILFDPTIYHTCQAVYNGSTTTVYFSRATDAEAWAADHYDALREASGYAVLDADNQLIHSSYTIHYRLGNAQVRKTFDVSFTPVESAIDKPNAADYQKLDDLDAPIALERACGFLLQAETVSAKIADTVVCEAFGDHRTQETALKISGIGEAFSANMDISVTSVNSSRGGETTHKTQSITYENEVYTVIEDNGTPVIKNDTAPETMRLFCQDSLVGTILLPEYVTAVTVSEEDGIRTYAFSANETLSQLMSQSVCSILYQNPDLLNTMASAHTTNTMEGYLSIDTLTGLPTASGIRYGSIYTVDEFPYTLQYISEQEYTLH